MVEIQQQWENIKKADWLQKWIAKTAGISLNDKTNLFRLLAVSVKAWLGVRDSLTWILKTEKNTGLRIVLQDLINQLTAWAPLSKAILNHPYVFEVSERELIKSSETMGNMPETLKEIADELENFQRIQQKIKSAMSYPIVLIVFAVLAVSVLLVKVVPTIISLFPCQEMLPWITRFMIQVSDFMIKWWWILIIWAVWIVATYTFLYSKVLIFKIWVDKAFLSIPAVSDVVRTYYMYRFSKLMADFNKAGVSPVITMLQIADIFENYHYKKKVMEVKNDLEAWFGYSEALEWSELFDPLLIQIILVGESTGNIAEVLEKMATFYREVLQTKIAILMGLIEPIMMAFIAVIIGWIVGSIFLPLADLVNVIGGDGVTCS